MKRSRNSWIVAGALGGLLLHAVVGIWSETGFAQGSTNVTTTTSTTAHTTFVSPPDCGPVGTSSTDVSVTTTTSIGPTVILIGPNQSQTFFVAAGTVNVNTNTHTETFQCIAAVPALPWAALVSTAIGLGALGAWGLSEAQGKRRKAERGDS